MTEKEKWGIWCEVWGGITGSRSAWLKDIDAIWEGTKEEAETMVRILMCQPSEGRASFRYTAKLRKTKT
jgi:hypothetical protein